MTAVISYQGEPGAFSSQAALQLFPDSELLPCATFEDALSAVVEGTARYGVIPIDNSIAGRVADVHHLLPRSGLHIIGEHFLPIRFHLMGVEGATLATLKTVQSHIHALGQCRKIIRSNGWKAVVAGDTAGAAKLVSEKGDRTMAALAPRLAAPLYGLDIVAENVEDSENNVTRFVVLSRDENQPKRASDDETFITTFVFNVRNIPAALYKALGGFATNGVNMTKLESYQLEGKFTATQFYADVEGHPKDAGLKRALDELKFFSSELAILGVYPAHEFRVAARALEAEAALRSGAARG